MEMLNQYKEFLEELREELKDGTLSNLDQIKVLRSSEAVDGYKAIVDWYYDDATMNSLLEADELDSEEDKKELIEVKEQYLNDLPNLISITIDACIDEMDDKIHNR